MPRSKKTQQNWAGAPPGQWGSTSHSHTLSSPSSIPRCHLHIPHAHPPHDAFHSYIHTHSPLLPQPKHILICPCSRRLSLAPTPTTPTTSVASPYSNPSAHTHACTTRASPISFALCSYTLARPCGLCPVFLADGARASPAPTCHAAAAQDHSSTAGCTGSPTAGGRRLNLADHWGHP